MLQIQLPARLFGLFGAVIIVTQRVKSLCRRLIVFLIQKCLSGLIAFQQTQLISGLFGLFFAIVVASQHLKSFCSLLIGRLVHQRLRRLISILFFFQFQRLPCFLLLCSAVAVISQRGKGIRCVRVVSFLHQRQPCLIVFHRLLHLPCFLLFRGTVAVIPQRGKGIRCVRVVSFLHQYQRCLISLLCFCCLRTSFGIAENHNPDPAAGKYQCDSN